MWDKKKISQIREARNQWEEDTLARAIERSPEREIFSDLPKKRLYTPEDLRDFDYQKDLNFPGEYPYTRGIH
ncbi:MAG: methylmalonyl-CoA mutase family protein, partial [Thermodesulfobacteriota bacterium]|nr:methylmalonyl-CoA mutase family protein [Thermodesulfobacteriota bacterium]